MVQRTGGFRRKTRNKFSKQAREKGKVSIRRVLQTFSVGDSVTLAADPANQGGLYHPRFHGKAGTVKGTQGDCILVEVVDGNKKKELIIHPVHLRRG